MRKKEKVFLMKKKFFATKAEEIRNQKITIWQPMPQNLLQARIISRWIFPGYENLPKSYLLITKGKTVNLASITLTQGQNEQLS